jgi:hypothetical protein
MSKYPILFPSLVPRLHRPCLPFPLAVIVVLIMSTMLGAFAGTAYAYPTGYRGWGYFTQCANGATCRINRNGVISDWSTPIDSAWAVWSNDTDLVLGRVYDDSWHVYIRPTYNGNSGFNGWTVIGTPAGTNDGRVDGDNYLNNNYLWCFVYVNRSYGEGLYGGGWNFDQRKQVTMHELGHCWSLEHRAPDSIMAGFSSQTYLNAADKSYVNDRY